MRDFWELVPANPWERRRWLVAAAARRRTAARLDAGCRLRDRLRTISPELSGALFLGTTTCGQCGAGGSGRRREQTFERRNIWSACGAPRLGRTDMAEVRPNSQSARLER